MRAAPPLLRSQYDDGSGTITPKELEQVLMILEPPLGLGLQADNKDVLRWGQMRGRGC